MDAFVAFMESKSIWVYVCIFLAETLYTALSTLRGVLVNRGERLASAFIALFEIIIWVIVTGAVLGSVTSDPLKILVYALAFALGIFLGSLLEKRLALGTVSLSIFLPEDETVEELIDKLKENGYGATILDATGIIHTRRKVIMVVAKRKHEIDLINLINSITENAVITVSAVASMKGGYMTGNRRRFIFPVPKFH